MKLEELYTQSTEFITRHNGPRSKDHKSMLESIGVKNFDELISKTVPDNIRLTKDLELPDSLSEYDYLKRIKEIAQKNKLFKNYIGMGYSPSIVPPVILRNILENPGWYTQYTPYQAEISQGRLEMLLNFQTVISDLTGLEIANASLLDEGTAAAEAMTLAYRVKPRSKKEAHTLFISENCHPQTIDVVKTRALPLDIDIEIGNEFEADLSDPKYYAIMVSYPDTYGTVHNYDFMMKTAKDNELVSIFVADLMALTILKEPGKMGADVVVGSAQRFGVPLGFGGPHAAFLATKDEFKRSVPGRIIGISKDRNDEDALRMALQTREQHIRRDKATSNICTAQALLANMAAAYSVYHGPEGLKQIAMRIHMTASALAQSLKELGFELVSDSFFDTITVKIANQGHHSSLRMNAEAKMINFRYDENLVGISISEQTEINDIVEIIELFEKLSGKSASKTFDNVSQSFDDSMNRSSTFLTHPNFHLYHSETEMMRYLKRLENKDLSLTTSMIPLGSCTMKLNAVTEMIPVTWPELGDIHPFASVDQTEGYLQIFKELEAMLSEITGFHSMSLQPNAGAQGEYAGLLVIKKYHEHNGDHDRNIVLIPSSAHGTNPASAVLAGMKVVVVKCDDNGNIDVENLKEKAEKHKDELAALMVTYPSTHGVFEKSIIEICDIIHANGGQVYMDGANMNAQVGLTSPANIGADVCHLNLHKTFCIPHGGGGPGMGPIGVVEHLSPFLPSHPVVSVNDAETQMGTISAAPWGSASILVISHAYIAMTGSAGLKEATEVAIMNANYLRSKLENHYHVLYKGEQGFVAHELIFDCREFKKSAGIEVEDIAKRLMDYGFHAPTMSFPVAGTMMVEPTESESKEELDRFVEAMIAIREEIKEVEDGKSDKEDNVLKNSPHTSQMISSDEWIHSYSRDKAAFPVDYLKAYKYWPPVARVNNVLGDRELICTCPPIEAYQD
jgi:glycine dehydrogenase